MAFKKAKVNGDGIEMNHESDNFLHNIYFLIIKIILI